MDTTTVINTEISVDRILALTADKQSLQNTINSLNKEIGSKEALIEKLENDLAEAKEKQPEVRIITQERKVRDSWGCIEQTTSTEYKNLHLVQDDIRKEIDSTYKEQIDSLKKEITNLKEELATIRENYNIRSKQLEFDYKKYRQEVELDYAEEKLNVKKVVLDKDKEITLLKKELEKVKNDKTDEQLNEKRAQEIVDLRLRIEELELTIKEMESTNIFKRIWNSILNGKARVIAQKQLIEKKNLVNSITGWWY